MSRLPAAHLDDLVLQFDSVAGHRVQSAWQHARVVIDAGHAPAAPQPPTP